MTPSLFDVQNTALLTHNKVEGIPRISLNITMDPIQLRLIQPNRFKIMVDSSGDPWQKRLKVLTSKDYFHTHQFDNHLGENPCE